MKDFLLRLILAGVIMGVLDALWLMVVAKRFYRDRLGDLLADKPNPVAAVPVSRAVPVVTAAHLPPVADDVAHTRLALGAFARPWPGEVLVTDEGTGAELATLASRATLGTLTAPFAAGTMFRWDSVNVLEVELLSGHMASRDEAEALAGANRIAVETDSGEWEIVGFAQAELIAPRTYRLTRLLRGQGGTDHAIGTAAAGNRAMVLDSRASFEPVDAAWLGQTTELLCFAGAADATGVAVEASIGLAPMLPLMPVHLHAVADGSDVALSWVRRSRADTDSWATEDAPLDWAPEAYRVEIFDRATLKRTIDVTAPAASYTAAQQAADFGGPAAAFTWRVAQVSALYGPGHWATGDFDA